MNDVVKTGTTTVGIMCKDCIILAADKRATAGNLIVDKNIEKVVLINDRIAVTTAGSVSEIQLLNKYIRAEIKLKEIRTNRRVTIKEVANLMSSLAYEAIRTRGGVAHFILAGVDTDVHMYDVYPDGSITEVKDFVSSGSGSVFAYGVLENNYKANLTEEQGIDMAVSAINASVNRDTMSGQGVDVFVIDAKGVRKVFTKLLNTKLSR